MAEMTPERLLEATQIALAQTRQDAAPLTDAELACGDGTVMMLVHFARLLQGARPTKGVLNEAMKTAEDVGLLCYRLLATVDARDAALRAAWERERGWERTARQIVEWGPTTSSDRYMHTCWLQDALEGRFQPEDDEAATPAPQPTPPEGE